MLEEEKEQVCCIPLSCECESYEFLLKEHSTCMTLNQEGKHRCQIHKITSVIRHQNAEYFQIYGLFRLEQIYKTVTILCFLSVVWCTQTPMCWLSVVWYTQPSACVGLVQSAVHIHQCLQAQCTLVYRTNSLCRPSIVWCTHLPVSVGPVQSGVHNHQPLSAQFCLVYTSTSVCMPSVA